MTDRCPTNVKYEFHGMGYKQTNRDYLSTLSNEELANTIYDIIVDRVGRRYNSSRLGVAQWLGEEYRKEIFQAAVIYNKFSPPDKDNFEIKCNNNEYYSDRWSRIYRSKFRIL